MASRRLLKERASFENDPLSYCQISLPSEQDMFTWKVLMDGPPNTPYVGGVFPILVQFPAQYPFKAPKLKFLIKVYHPSVNKDGEICADVVSEGWGPTLNVRHCLQVLYAMLQFPETDHPLDEEIATVLKDKPKEFDKMAKKYTKEFAKP